MDSVYLDGSEAVANAGRNIRQAADDMRMAASQIDETFRMFTNRIEEWVTRLEALKEE